MFCEKCGRKLEDTTSFCPYCGYKVTIFQRDDAFSGSALPFAQNGFAYTETDSDRTCGLMSKEGFNGVSMNTTPGYVESAAENKHGLVRTNSVEKKKGDPTLSAPLRSPRAVGRGDPGKLACRI